MLMLNENKKNASHLNGLAFFYLKTLSKLLN